MSRPAFADLPLRQGDPPFSSWFLYGPDDQLGTLNLLTPTAVCEAAKEIRTGIRIGLDTRLDYLTCPPHDRKPLKHTIIHKYPRAVHDDIVEFNTQISSQWDGFKHFGYQNLGLFYNCNSATHLSGEEMTENLGLHAWCAQGIVGRGVLLDYDSWSRMQGVHYDRLGDHSITLEALQAVATAQNVQFCEGDILLIRTGFHVGYEAMTPEARIHWSQQRPMKHVGVESSKAMAKWLWDTGLSACASDAPAFEAMPKRSNDIDDLFLHEIMLAGWGMPIGELWDLESLSIHCAKEKRYTFFITSMPLHVVGGVGSPSNAIAIF